jgi:hypothetical protein
MAEEEKEKAEAGMSPLHNVNMGEFLQLGFDIQNIQCVFLHYFIIRNWLIFGLLGKPSTLKHVERGGRPSFKKPCWQNGGLSCSSGSSAFMKSSKFTCLVLMPKAMLMHFKLNHATTLYQPILRIPNYFYRQSSAGTTIVNIVLLA